MTLQEQLEQIYSRQRWELNDLTNRQWRGEDLKLIIAARETTLEQTWRALKRARQGKAGLCEHCDIQIEQERLAAIPTATLCKDCVKKLVELKPNRRAYFLANPQSPVVYIVPA